MGVGLAAAFYFVHIRIWVVPITDGRGQLTLWIGGTANKNQDVFREKFAKLVDKIETQIRQAKHSESETKLESASETLARS